MTRFLIIAMLCCSSAYGQMLQGNNNDVQHGGAPTFSPSIITAYSSGVDNAYYQAPIVAITAPSLVVYSKTPGGFVGGANNCALMAVHSSVGLTQSTPTDDKSETWVAGPSVTLSGNISFKLWYVLGTTAGTQKITIATTGSSTQGGSVPMDSLGAMLMELENCGTSVGGNGTLNTAATGSALTLTLSAAPSSGDMPVGFFIDGTVAGNGSENPTTVITSVTAGTNYTARLNSLTFGKFAEYSTTSTSTSMQFTPSGTDTWLGLGLVIKKGLAGSAPSGKYIDTWQEEQYPGVSTSATFKFPFTGNTAALMLSTGVDHISSITGSTCTWNTGALENNSATNAQIAYGTSCTASSTATVTPTFNANPGNPGTTITLVSMSGMTSSLDSSATTSLGACSASSGLVTCSGNSGSTSTISMVGITPSATNEITLVVGSQSQHTTVSVATDANSHVLQLASGVNTKGDDAIDTCDGSTPPSTLSDDNPFAFYLNASDTNAQTYTFNGTWVTAGGLGNCLAQPTGASTWGAVGLALK